ncbi:MAG: c-type cytochrome [Saprospiraceae bacterium]|nr:c-type cytochrome [Saprospiraceae bacterium]
MKNLLCFILLALLAGSCQEQLILKESENILPEQQLAFESALDLPPVFANYDRKLPDYLKSLGLVVQPVDDGKATLGRVLFYDKNLSQDRTISCASCHKQELAFSDNVAVSTGIYGLKGTRNALPLGNVASFSAHYRAINGPAPQLLWDNRASSVEQQSTMAFLNDHEMGMTLQEVVNRIVEQPYYPYIWNKVYGNFNVTSDQVLECLSEFVGAMGAHDSRFDGGLEEANGNINISSVDTITSILPIYYGNGGDTLTTIQTTGIPGFTTIENRGRDIFVVNCSKCHSPLRTTQEVLEACTGLSMNYTDGGVGAISGNSNQVGVFKSPSLRNIALTAPYMHDGRFKTLMEVVSFYNNGVKNHPNLHPEMKLNLNLNASDLNALVAFLNTLTDHELIRDERFANPFKQ